MSTDNDLKRLAALTEAIHGNLRANERLADERREVALRLRDAGVTYKQMAEAAGLSEVYCYKILKGPSAVKKQEKETARRRRERLS